MEHVLCQFGSQPLRWSCWQDESVWALIPYVPQIIIFRQVREAEGNYNPMVTANDVIQAVGARLCHTTAVLLEAAQIDACDEENVRPVGPAFIKKYHHFSYAGPGVLSCRYIKGVGTAVRHIMRQGGGIVTNFSIFSRLYFF